MDNVDWGIGAIFALKKLFEILGDMSICFPPES